MECPKCNCYVNKPVDKCPYCGLSKEDFILFTVLQEYKKSKK